MLIAFVFFFFFFLYLLNYNRIPIGHKHKYSLCRLETGPVIQRHRRLPLCWGIRALQPHLIHNPALSKDVPGATCGHEGGTDVYLPDIQRNMLFFHDDQAKISSLRPHADYMWSYIIIVVCKYFDQIPQVLGSNKSEGTNPIFCKCHKASKNWLIMLQRVWCKSAYESC